MSSSAKLSNIPGTRTFSRPPLSSAVSRTTGEVVMTILAKILTAVLLYLFLFTPSTAHIISLKLQSDNRHIIPISDFEFSNAGYVSLEFSSVTFTSTTSTPDPSRAGFFLQSHKVEDLQPFELQQNTSINCDLDFELNSVLFTFQNLSHDPHTSFNKSTHPGMKSLFFVNCNNETLVTMDVRMELYNIDCGTTKNYLSAGLTQLPLFASILSFIYLSFLGFWVLICFKNRRCFNKTHLLMGGLLAINFLHFMCVAADLHYVKVTGTAHGLDILFYMFQLIRGVYMPALIVLIGAGWCFWKPFLEGKEKLFLMVVILLEVWANVDPIFPWEAAVPYNKEDWSLADVICCCYGFIFPIARSVMSLGEIHETDLNAHRNLGRLWLFSALVFVYVLIARCLVLMLPRWENYVVKETTILVSCVVVFYMFMPVDRMRMRMLGTRDEESGQTITSKSISCFYSLV